MVAEAVPIYYRRATTLRPTIACHSRWLRGDDDGHHLSAYRHQWRTELDLHRLSEWDRLTGTSIGILFAAIEITSGLGSLFAGWAMRLGNPQRTMLSGTVLSILLICITPFIGGAFALLFAAQAAHGWLQGVVQPMMFSVQAKAVGPHRQVAPSHSRHRVRASCSSV